MTYDSREISVQDGAPVELYEFARNAKVWRYTSSEQDIGDSSETWLSVPITRTAVETNTEQARNALKLTVPRNFEIADLFRVSPPTDIIALTVRRFHRGEEDDVAVIWLGRVLNCSFEGARAVLNCEPVSASLKRQGLRRLYQKQCPHALYGPGCNLDKEDFRHNTTVQEASGVTVTVASLPSQSAAGGWIEYEDEDGNLERRFIRSASGTTLILNLPFNEIDSNLAVSVFPGCNHTMEVCDGDYDNILNYGGMPFTPHKNPFDGTPIF